VLEARISVDPAVHFGQPCVAGTRIPVYCVLELVEAGIPLEEIVANHYPDINVQDVKACIHYAVDIIKAEEIHLAERST
jgi:uncharacterized protein (DUF433 family)